MAGDEILSSLTHDKTKFIGPSYNYSQQILTPLQVGLSGEGGFGQIADDVGGMIGYIEVLVSGISNNQKIPDKPLGNKFFVETLATCTGNDTGADETRYIYINNVPTGNIPLISTAAGVDFGAFRGLVPGVLTNLEVLDPTAMVDALLVGSKPECHKVKFPVVDINGVETTEEHYVVDDDVKHMDPCAIAPEPKPAWAIAQCDDDVLCTAASECTVSQGPSNNKGTQNTCTANYQCGSDKCGLWSRRNIGYGFGTRCCPNKLGSSVGEFWYKNDKNGNAQLQKWDNKPWCAHLGWHDKCQDDLQCTGEGIKLSQGVCHGWWGGAWCDNTDDDGKVTGKKWCPDGSEAGGTWSAAPDGSCGSGLPVNTDTDDSFQNMFINQKLSQDNNQTNQEQNKDTIKDIYFIILGLMGLYFLLKLLHKKC